MLYEQNQEKGSGIDLDEHNNLSLLQKAQRGKDAGANDSGNHAHIR